jgi:hypothetical protein
MSQPLRTTSDSKPIECIFVPYEPPKKNEGLAINEKVRKTVQMSSETNIDPYKRAADLLFGDESEEQIPLSKRIKITHEQTLPISPLPTSYEDNNNFFNEGTTFTEDEKANLLQIIDDVNDSLKKERMAELLDLAPKDFISDDFYLHSITVNSDITRQSVDEFLNYMLSKDEYGYPILAYRREIDSILRYSFDHGLGHLKNTIFPVSSKYKKNLYHYFCEPENSEYHIIIVLYLLIERPKNITTEKVFYFFSNLTPSALVWALLLKDSRNENVVNEFKIENILLSQLTNHVKKGISSEEVNKILIMVDKNGKTIFDYPKIYEILCSNYSEN